MKINHIVFITALLFLTACKKESAADEPVPANSEKTVTDTIIQQVSGTEKGISELKVLTDEFISAKKKIEKQLPALSKTEANKLYVTYHEKSFEIISKIELKEHLILENFYSIFFNEENSQVPHDSIQKKHKLLKNAELDFFEEGEGVVSIRPHHLFYYKIFKNYITDDYKEYLALEAKDNEKLWVADAAIVISWKELGEKVLSWENFVEKYSQSDLYTDAKNTYSTYQYWFLFGLDNTSVTENTDGSNMHNKIYPEIKKDMEEFVKKHPDSPAAKRAKRILDNDGKDYKKLREDILHELKIN